MMHYVSATSAMNWLFFHSYFSLLSAAAVCSYNFYKGDFLLTFVFLNKSTDTDKRTNRYKIWSVLYVNRELTTNNNIWMKYCWKMLNLKNYAPDLKIGISFHILPCRAPSNKLSADIKLSLCNTVWNKGSSPQKQKQEVKWKRKSTKQT